jgi:hypothetical protein
MNDHDHRGDTLMLLTDKYKIDEFFHKVETDGILSRRGVYIGLDFEFDLEFDSDRVKKKHIMSLGQIAITDQKVSIVAIFDFRIFTESQKKTFIDKILLNKNIKKILHGSESLDLPSLRVFLGDSSFKIFLTQIIDTRFLCEALLILKNKYQHFYDNKEKNKLTKKCSIYNALLDSNTIDQDEFKILSSIKVNYNHKWSIHNLTKSQISYAAADVLFLHNLLLSYSEILGVELIERISSAYIYSVLYRMGILDRKQILEGKTLDHMRNVKKSFNTPVLVKSDKNNEDIFEFTLEDLMKIDYIRKPLNSIFDLVK